MIFNPPAPSKDYTVPGRKVGGPGRDVYSIFVVISLFSMSLKFVSTHLTPGLSPRRTPHALPLCTYTAANVSHNVYHLS